MEAQIVRAVYKKGVLRPIKKLNLPENSIVEVRVTSMRKMKKETPFAALIGVWENLPEKEKSALDKSVRTVRKRSMSRVKKLAKKLK